jgi:hypothetical protein
MASVQDEPKKWEREILRRLELSTRPCFGTHFHLFEFPGTNLLREFQIDL